MSTDIQIYTIGHSSHPLGSFLWLLQKHGIEALADIRSSPGSRRHPHFSKESLSASLADEDIEYHWLDALGGHRSTNQGRSAVAESGSRGRVLSGLRRLHGFGRVPAGRGKAVGDRREPPDCHHVCRRRLYRHCHRRFLCDHLLANGVTVLHILPTGEVKPHKLTAGAKVVDGTVTYPGQPTLFDVG